MDQPIVTDVKSNLVLTDHLRRLLATRESMRESVAEYESAIQKAIKLEELTRSGTLDPSYATEMVFEFAAGSGVSLSHAVLDYARALNAALEKVGI
jgi:hypothetical protein